MGKLLSKIWQRRNKYNVIDLFCGCGGLSLGFEKAGFDILLGIDSNAAKGVALTREQFFRSTVIQQVMKHDFIFS